MTIARLLAVPTAGLRVPFPGRSLAEPLRPEGEVVAASNYWARRAMHGECVLTTVPVVAPTEDHPAPDAAPDEPQEPRARRKEAR